MYMYIRAQEMRMCVISMAVGVVKHKHIYENTRNNRVIVHERLSAFTGS